MGIARAGGAGGASNFLNFLFLLRASAVNQSNVCIRLARRDDIAGIQNCNLKTLPENYDTPFYVQHLLNWPHLALVAEYLDPDASQSGRRDGDGYVGKPGLSTAEDDRSGSEIVGYVLGRMDTDLQKIGKTSRMSRNGHITSLAVLPSFRRQGLAQKLMDQVHEQMVDQYDAEHSSLHVRVSNAAAKRLYQDALGYDIVNVIDRYYQDGENAYLMRSQLKSVTPSMAVLMPEPGAADTARPSHVEPEPKWHEMPPPSLRRGRTAPPSVQYKTGLRS